jgi:hypothetical protein
MSHAVAIGNHTAMQTMFVMGSKKSGFDHYSTGGFNLLDTESSQAHASAFTGRKMATAPGTAQETPVSGEEKAAGSNAV